MIVPNDMWPRLLVRGNLLGVGAVALLVGLLWLTAEAIPQRLVDMSGGTTEQSTADQAAPGGVALAATNLQSAEATVTSLLSLVSLGGIVHIALNCWLFQQLRHQRYGPQILAGAALNLLSMPIGTVLGLGVLLRALQHHEQNEPPSSRTQNKSYNQPTKTR
jgi:hypothetical protein